MIGISEKEKARHRAKKRSIYRNWILGLALPIAVSTIVLGIAEFDLWAQVFTWDFLVVVIVTVGVTVLSAYLWGAVTFRREASEDETDHD